MPTTYTVRWADDEGATGTYHATSVADRDGFIAESEALGLTVTTPATEPGTVESLLAANRLAGTILAAASQNLFAAFAARQLHGVPLPADVIAAYEQASADVAATLKRVIFDAPVGSEVWTTDGPMKVAEISHDAPLNGMPCPTVTLTEDALPALSEWADDVDDDMACRYERYTPAGRFAHGFVDAVTRKIVQTG